FFNGLLVIQITSPYRFYNIMYRVYRLIVIEPCDTNFIFNIRHAFSQEQSNLTTMPYKYNV
ncbi:MAG TPA: hypothetical protein PK714_06265, partial [Nitrosomonas sp.]|nr:hypothetical protein [Nitrosomonas sp.]